jgi:hypothetical protein
VATEQKDRDGTTLKVLFDFEDIPAKRRDWRIFEVQMENLPEIVVNSPIDLDKEVESNPLPKQEPKRRAGVVIRFLVARGRSPMTGDE